MIEVKALSKDYFISKRKHFFAKKEVNAVHAVQDISFEIQDGEKVGVIGLNGSGKTTTLKMLSGILTPSSGEICINGFEPQKRQTQFLSQIGVSMGQRSVLFFDIPLRYSLEYYKEVYHISDSDYKIRIDEFDEVMNIKEIMDTPVRKLSFGQRRKAELVCAMLHLPKLLLLDEPTIGLDVVVKEKIFQFLTMMNQRYRCTILLTTHELENIEKFCQRILVLKKGKIIYDGKISEFSAMSNYRKIYISNEFYKEQKLCFPYAVETERGMEIFIDITKKENLNVFEKLLASDFSMEKPSLEDVIKSMERN